MAIGKLYLTSQDLIDSIKNRANIPDTQDMISDEEILAFANEEMMLNFIPLVYSRHEDYYLVRQEIPLEAGVARYPIPYRAIASKVREVAIQTTNGDFREMFRISVDDVTSGYSQSNNSVKNYYFEGEEIVLHVQEANFLPASGENLVVFYNLSPNALVESERVGVISNISDDGTYTQLDFNTIPTVFSQGAEIDFIKTKAPHRVVSYDKTIQEIGVVGVGGYIKVNMVDLPRNIKVGDRIALAGETDVVNAPSDLHSMLAQMVAERVLEAIGDEQGLASAGRKLAKMEKNASLILDNRSIGSPIKAKARNGTIRTKGLGKKRYNV